MQTLPTWYYNDLQQVGVDFEDPAEVAAFDRNQTSSTVAAERSLVAQFGISRGHTVIDLGSGTGTFAIQAALAGADVYAVDVSKTMLAYAQEKAIEAKAENIQFHHAGFLSYEHQAAPVDFVVTKAALHHIPDFWKQVALSRIAAMLKHGGVLYLRDVIFSFPPDEYQSQIERWIQRAAKPFGEGFTIDDFETHVREEHSTFAWIVEGMLDRVGFDVQSNYLSPTMAEYICRKR
ncbi:SAM-dependent methyltransferase [cyanobacterium TDX16]|nr:SAM-dependent methyltransferase [cyanobacterium TDX16]